MKNANDHRRLVGCELSACARAVATLQNIERALGKTVLF